MPNQRIDYLFLRYYYQTATKAEREEFMALVRSEEDQIKAMIQDRLSSEEQVDVLSAEKTNRILEGIIQGKRSDLGSRLSLDTDQNDTASPERKRPVFASVWSWAAASVVLIAGFWGYQSIKDSIFTEFDQETKHAVAIPISPGKDRAQLALSDGTIVSLGASRSDSMLTRNGISNNRVKGELVYKKQGNGEGFNTLTTPMGGQYKVVLPDGSKAWLNAGSSLTYPTEFSSPNRMVEMMGEVYFEIFPNKEHPFVVKVKSNNGRRETEIRVLGTHFNVSSYNNEPAMQTTLLEGAVEIASGGERQTLSPGQQAQIRAEGKDAQAIAVKAVDASSVIAWTEGRFEFNGNIKEIMRQVSRWYNVEVIYEGNVENKAFAGTISRKKEVTEVLEMLQLTGRIRFVVVDRKIIVKPF